MSSDAELLRRYVEERSESAFAQLVNEHLNLVYSAALRETTGDRGWRRTFRKRFSRNWRTNLKGFWGIHHWRDGSILPYAMYPPTCGVRINAAGAGRRRSTV